MRIIIIMLMLSCLGSNAQSNSSLILNKKEKTNNYLKQSYTPSLLIVAGAISEINFGKSLDKILLKERNMNIPLFKTNVDDYLQYSPILLAYGFDAIGMSSKTDIANRTAILLKSQIFMSASVTSLKYSIGELRPDSSARNSVPSGHTAQAFAAATFLSEEFGKEYKWVPYLSYSIASTVGAFRIMNNKHYLSDVLIGAGIGILSTKISYWTHQYKWGKNKKNVTQK